MFLLKYLNFYISEIDEYAHLSVFYHWNFLINLSNVLAQIGQKFRTTLKVLLNVSAELFLVNRNLDMYDLYNIQNIIQCQSTLLKKVTPL